MDEHYGESACYRRSRGREMGEGLILSPMDEAEVQAAMAGHLPEDYEIDSALWTRQAVQALMEQLSGIKLPIRIDQPVKQLFLISDRYPIHLNLRVQQGLKEHSQKLEMFYLPAYSPQLNPVEYLNGDVKQGVHDKPPSRNLHQFKQRLLSHLRKLQKLPARIKSYFQHPSIAYAAL